MVSFNATVAEFEDLTSCEDRQFQETQSNFSLIVRSARNVKYVRSVNFLIDTKCLVSTRCLPIEKRLLSTKSLLITKSLPSLKV